MRVVVDASAAMAIFLDEADADDLEAKLQRASERFMSPINLWEARVQIYERAGADGEAVFASWLESAKIEIVPISARQSEVAVAARKRYRVRPARLNLGDCFAYALAKELDAVLLFKGNDFLETDVKRWDADSTMV